MGTAGLIESFELRQLNLVILSAAHGDISVRIISHEITSALSDCILFFFFYDMTASEAFSSSRRSLRAGGESDLPLPSPMAIWFFCLAA